MSGIDSYSKWVSLKSIWKKSCELLAVKVLNRLGSVSRKSFSRAALLCCSARYGSRIFAAPQYLTFSVIFYSILLLFFFFLCSSIRSDLTRGFILLTIYTLLCALVMLINCTFHIFSSPSLALRASVALRAKYRVRPACLIKRLSCRLLPPRCVSGTLAPCCGTSPANK